MANYTSEKNAVKIAPLHRWRSAPRLQAQAPSMASISTWLKDKLPSLHLLRRERLMMRMMSRSLVQLADEDDI